VGVFSVLPENFFSPLARVNRQHYAALLVLYYRLFQENTRGLERELVIHEFMGYLALHQDSLADEENDETGESAALAAAEDPEARELDFGGPKPPETSAENVRTQANYFLRRLINSGWLSEEYLADASRIINITAWGKPFFESLAKVVEGLKTEYESHVVIVYSSICG
jgi:hypothetical protein